MRVGWVSARCERSLVSTAPPAPDTRSPAKRARSSLPSVSEYDCGTLRMSERATPCSMADTTLGRADYRRGDYQGPWTCARAGATHREPGAFTDLVQQQFRAAAPGRLWVTDITQHPTSAGWITRQSSSTSTHAAASAGRSQTTCAPTSSTR